VLDAIALPALERELLIAAGRLPIAPAADTHDRVGRASDLRACLRLRTGAPHRGR
jgi:hypothetical protein